MEPLTKEWRSQGWRGRPGALECPGARVVLPVTAWMGQREEGAKDKDRERGGKAEAETRETWDRDGERPSGQPQGF